MSAAVGIEAVVLESPLPIALPISASYSCPNICGATVVVGVTGVVVVVAVAVGVVVEVAVAAVVVVIVSSRRRRSG